MKKNPLIIHPFLFAIFPIVFLVSHNIEQVVLNSSEIYIIAAVLVAFSCLMWLLLGLILKDKQKAGLLVSLFLFLFFSYGHFFKLIDNLHLNIGEIVIGENKLLFTTWCIFLLAGSYFTIRTRKNLSNLTKVVNIVAFSLVCISIVNIIAYKVKTGRHYHRRASVTVGYNPDERDQAGSFPDIYYLIFDRYGSESVLKEFYDFDNSEFIAYLTEKGFYVGSKSRANYLKTEHSLASSLNMEYINYLSEELGENSNYYVPLFEMTNDCKVGRFLKAKGYKFIYFGCPGQSYWKNKIADLNIYLGYIREITDQIYQTTMFYPLGLRWGILDMRYLSWKRTNYQFNKLAKIPDIKEPTFVVAHIFLPHVPYVFHQDGSYKTYDEEKRRTQIQNYRDQVIFANKQIKELIAKILSNSEMPPIIILQSDEGPWPSRYWIPPWNKFNWLHATKSEIRQKFGILNAYFLPGVDKSVLYPDITPVNTFRLVFNSCFNTNFELLPDKVYAFVDLDHPYKFFDVTNNNKKFEAAPKTDLMR